MRHRQKGRKLGRNASHRLALFRNLSRALITHERIRTTVPKAKELRPFIEKLITYAKKGVLALDAAAAATDPKIKALESGKALHYRRLCIQYLGPMHGTTIWDKDDEPVTRPGQGRNGKVGNPVDVTIVEKLFKEIAPRFKTRPGGYTRILKLTTRRLGDAGEQALIEFIGVNETKPAKERPAPAAPAPRPAPAPETPTVSKDNPATSTETPAS
jgi:large subunit ribosomal protein L17